MYIKKALLNKAFTLFNIFLWNVYFVLLLSYTESKNIVFIRVSENKVQMRYNIY